MISIDSDIRAEYDGLTRTEIEERLAANRMRLAELATADQEREQLLSQRIAESAEATQRAIDLEARVLSGELESGAAAEAKATAAKLISDVEQLSQSDPMKTPRQIAIDRLRQHIGAAEIQLYHLAKAAAQEAYDAAAAAIENWIQTFQPLYDALDSALSAESSLGYAQGDLKRDYGVIVDWKIRRANFGDIPEAVRSLISDRENSVRRMQALRDTNALIEENRRLEAERFQQGKEERERQRLIREAGFPPTVLT